MDGSGFGWQGRSGLAASRRPGLAPRASRPLSLAASEGKTASIGPAPGVTASSTPRPGRARSPWVALAVSACLHASAGLALVTAQAALSGSAGDTGLADLTLAAAPDMQVTLVTPADLLPATPPAPPPDLSAGLTAPPSDTAPPALPALAAAPAAPAPETPPLLAAPNPAAEAPLPPQLSPEAPPAPVAEVAPQPRPKAAPPPKPEKTAKAEPKAEAAAPKPEKPAKVAKSAPAPTAGSTASGSGGGDLAGSNGTAAAPGASDAEIADLKAQWGAQIAARITARVSYPAGADGASGTVKLRVTVARSGKLLEVVVRSSSGSAVLDKAALRAVKSARLPKAPKGLTQDSYTISVPLKYQAP